MPLRDIPLSSVTAADIANLVSTGTRESRDLDFKRDYSLAKDSEKKEFVADVSAFANSIGGDLVYGVEEHDGIAVRVHGIVAAARDAELLRIESILANGISPRLAGVQARFVELNQERCALIVRVPESGAAPHMVVQEHRFYGRSASQKFPMDVRQLRDSFSAADSLLSRARRFREERLRWVETEEVGPRLDTPHLVVLHLLPVQAMREPNRFDVAALRKIDGKVRPLVVGGGWSSFVNFDGFRIAELGAPGKQLRYVQVFRNGAVEAVDTDLISGPQKAIYADYEIPIRNGVISYLAALGSLDMAGECLIGLSLLRVKGFSPQTGRMPRLRTPIDRDNLIVPEISVDIRDGEAVIEQALRACFDMVWNAGGVSGSPNYDEKGRFNPKPT